MNNEEVIEWIQQHLTRLEVLGHMGHDTYLMHYVDIDGVEHVVEGADLQDCVRGAAEKLASRVC